MNRTYPLRAVPGYYGKSEGIQIGTYVSSTATDEELQFLQQLGVEWAMLSVNEPSHQTAEYYKQFNKRLANYGLQIYRIANSSVHNMEEVTLNLEGRDAKIEEFCTFIRNLGEAGIYYNTYAHMGNGIWHTERETTRGSAPARGYDMSKGGEGIWAGKTFKGPLSHGRVYTEAELWDNYEYFISRVARVAEENDVRIGIHPDDPPVPMLAGVPRCIFGTFEGYKRALEMANSSHVGVCFCVGTWLEGGDLMGADVVTAIKYFGERGKIWKVHFRNMSAPLPHFVETFVDNGYYDMYAAMKALREVNFDGIVIGG